MVGDVFDTLVSDIHTSGLLQPITLYEGKILDGRNRYRACAQLAIDPKFTEFVGPGTPEQFVVSLNLHRRHLNETQRGMIATEMARLADGARADYAKAAGGGISPPAISQTAAAKLLNVSRATVKNARVVLERGTPEEVAGAKTGDLAVGTVAADIRAGLSPQERSERRATPPHKRNGHEARMTTMSDEVAVYGHLRDALNALAGMPLASDGARIARRFDRSNVVKRQLPVVTAWLAEFGRAWNNDKQEDQNG
jgi:ParB-like chromosome segregation protein Spo0J